MKLTSVLWKVQNRRSASTLSSCKYTMFDRFISYALNSMKVNCTLFIVQYIVIWPSPTIYLFEKQVLLLHEASQKSQKSMREIDIQPFMKCNIVIKIAFLLETEQNSVVIGYFYDSPVARTCILLPL